MKHKVKISVSERPETGGVIACRSITLSRITVYDEKMEVTFKSGLIVEVEM